jgi:hypothetical protein
MTPEEEEQFMAFTGLIQWTQSVIREGKRLRDLTSQQPTFPLLSFIKRQELILSVHTECHFFAISAYKMIQHIKWVRDCDLCKKVDFGEIDQFSSRDIQDLRDMREHIIDYFKGGADFRAIKIPRIVGIHQK